jgi:mono/diheme cytochrome c family protein
MSERPLGWQGLLRPAIPACIALLVATLPARAFFHNEPDIDRGRTIYAERCAVCHGANLEGQPDWQSANADGLYPAPPHDENGHTWHHGDAMLLDYIRRGGQAVLDDMDVEYTSGMPGFASDLSEADIEAVLAFIKSTWPEPLRAMQSERTDAEAMTP